MSGLIFIDTETTGLDPERHDLWEVAAIEEDGTEHHWFLSADMAKADPIALSIGGYHDRHPYGWTVSAQQGGYVPMIDNDVQFALDFGRLTCGAHLVGAVPHFDEAFLKRRLRKRGFSPAWHHHLIDVEAMALGWLNGHATAWREVQDSGRIPDLITTSDALPPAVNDNMPWKSDDLARTCGIDPPTAEERHTALGDARWVKRWYEAMVGGGS